ncbi:hypothetical protein N7540_010968 [Penicillium herquei]|nr:hypothetical protein N7540_010968 [Penicillium herquei]
MRPSALTAIEAKFEKAIPIDFLRLPAHSALKELLRLRTSPSSRWKITSQQALSPDAEKVRQACQCLWEMQVVDQIPINDALLSATAKTLVESLSRSTVEKLSVITWHFDSSGAVSEGLRCFLRRPIDNAGWEAVHRSYQTMTKQNVPFQEFKASHDFLLYPALG